jgi:hypothetical protein
VEQAVVKFKHYIFSRVNCAFVGDERGLRRVSQRIKGCRFNSDWLSERCELLETYTLPSIKSQTVKDFEFVLLAHTSTPVEFKKRLESYGTVVYGRLPPRELIPEYVKSHTDTPWVITSNLDSDDAISVDFVETLHREAVQNTEFLNFPRGFKYDVSSNKFYGVMSRKNPYGSFVEKTCNVKGIHAVVHGKYDEYATIRQIGQGGYWIQVCHGNNLMNRAVRRNKDKGKFYEDIADRFVIKRSAV